MRAAIRALPVAGRPKFFRELPRPLYISHRVGGSTGYGPYPENTVESAEFLLADGARVLNYDGNAALSDGTLANQHDTTVDRTTNGTGNVSSFSVAAYKALRMMPSKSWGPGFPDATWLTHLFSEVIDVIGARACHAPECNVVGSGATVAAMYNSRGLKDYVQVECGTIAEANALVAAGIPTVYLVSAGEAIATTQGKWAASKGPIGIDYYQGSPPGGTIDAYIQALIVAGYTVQVFSINRKEDAAAAIASAAAAGGVLDGVISNDPIYMDTRIWRARKTDSFATGRFGHGLIVGAGGGSPRIGIYGANRLGYGPDYATTGSALNLGEISPLPTGNYTITFDVCWEAIPSGATAYAYGLINGASDKAFNGTSGTAQRFNGYQWRLNQNGLLTLFKNTGAGTTQTTLGAPIGSTVMQPPLLLTGALTSGAAITSLPVRAVPSSIPSGTIFMLPTGQKVTTSGVTSAAATSVTIASVTPTAGVPSGTRCPQAVPLSIQLTSTQVICKRVDTNETITATDSTYRAGGYCHFGKSGGTATSITDGVINSGSAVLTSATAAFSVATDEDKILTGTGIPTGTRVLSVDSATQVTLTAAATATNAALTFTLARPNNHPTWANVTVT